MAQIAGAIWIYANNGKLEELVRYTVKTTVQLEYGSAEGRTETFDAIQSGVSDNYLFFIVFIVFQHFIIGLSKYISNYFINQLYKTITGFLCIFPGYITIKRTSNVN